MKPGRSYEDAVKLFSPYEETKEIADDARGAAAELIRMRMEAAQSRQTKGSFVFVYNRLEGNALFTILGILSRLGFDLGTGRVA